MESRASCYPMIDGSFGSTVLRPRGRAPPLKCRTVRISIPILPTPFAILTYSYLSLRSFRGLVHFVHRSFSTPRSSCRSFGIVLRANLTNSIRVTEKRRARNRISLKNEEQKKNEDSIKRNKCCREPPKLIANCMQGVMVHPRRDISAICRVCDIRTFEGTRKDRRAL